MTLQEFITESRLSKRAQAVLKSLLDGSGFKPVKTAQELSLFSERELLRIRGVGKKTAREILSSLSLPASGPFEMFPVRARNVFDNMNLKTEEEVIRAINSKILNPFHRCCRNYGVKTHLLVCSYFKIQDPSVSSVFVSHPDCSKCRGKL